MSGISRNQSARVVRAFGGRGRVYAVYASIAFSREGDRHRLSGSISMTVGMPNPAGCRQPGMLPVAA